MGFSTSWDRRKNHSLKQAGEMGFSDVLPLSNESMVSFVSRRYMRGENGTESLMVC